MSCGRDERVSGAGRLLMSCKGRGGARLDGAGLVGSGE